MGLNTDVGNWFPISAEELSEHTESPRGAYSSQQLLTSHLLFPSLFPYVFSFLSYKILVGALLRYGKVLDPPLLEMFNSLILPALNVFFSLTAPTNIRGVGPCASPCRITFPSYLQILLSFSVSLPLSCMQKRRKEM